MFIYDHYIEDSCCNGLADDVFPSPVSSGPHCTKTNLQRSENRGRKVRFHELSGLFLLFTVERIIFPDHLLDAFSFTFYGFMGDSEFDRNQFHPLSLFLLLVTTSDSPQYTVLRYSL